MSFVSVTLLAVCAMVLIANCNGLPLQQMLTTTTETSQSTLNSLDSQLNVPSLGAVDYTKLDNYSSSSSSSSSSDDYDYGSSSLLSDSTLDDYIQSQQQYYSQNTDYTTQQQLQQRQQLQNTLNLSQQQLQQQQLQKTLNPSSLPSGLSPLDNELYTQTVSELNYEAADQTQTIINNVNVDYNNSSDSS